MLLTDQPDLPRAEPKTLRYRLLHTAARITRGQRKVFLRLAEDWPLALALARAFRRLRQISLRARHHYRLFCKFHYSAEGVNKPLLVVMDGRDKPFRT